MPRIVTTKQLPGAQLLAHLSERRLTDGSEQYDIVLSKLAVPGAAWLDIATIPLTGMNELSALGQFEQLVSTIDRITP